MKNIPFVKWLFVILSLVVGAESGAMAQRYTPTDSAALRALSVGRALSQERVYLHFDNTAYYLGETMWFKAYVTSHSDDRATNQSRVLYVELLAPEGYVVKTEKYKIADDGTCHGEIYLDPAYLSGYYEIRAYTRYMLNWGDDAVFSRVFPVYDKLNNADWEFRNMLDRPRSFKTNNDWVDSDPPECDLKFYPEGGHLVAGLESRVAYELRSLDGIPGAEEITILADGKPLFTTTPRHQGKGTFTLTSQKDVEYRATVSVKNKKGKEKIHKFELPEVETEGVTLSVSGSSDTIRFSINDNYTTATDLGFAVLHRSNMGFYRRLGNGTTAIELPSDTLPEGVCRAVVFSGETPLAERLFFVRHDSLQAGDRQTVKLRVTANGDAPHKLKLQPHERVTLTVEREDGKPLNANSNYAVAVVDQAGVQTTSWGYNLYTYQLLGSELKGYIPDAWQYFDPENKERDSHLDLIMLTHGWTAYDWSRLTATDMSRVVPAEKGLTLRGQYYRRYKNNKFGKKGCVSIALNKYAPIMLHVPQDTLVAAYPFRTDSIGHFAVDIEDFYGRKVLALSPSNPGRRSKNSWDVFMLDRYFSPSPRLLSYWERNIGSSFMQVENISDSVKKISPIEYQLSTLNVKDNKRDSRYLRKPISELRLDYMEEWEYAMDITYRYGVYDFTRYYMATMNKYIQENEYLYKSFLFDYGDHTRRLLLYDKGNENHYKDMTETGGSADDTSGDAGTAIQWDGSLGYYWFRENLPQYRNTITVSNVIQSIFARYNLHWCYWVMPAVIEGEYNNDSLPVIDNDYLHGIDVWKMTNFSEIILSSARKHCEMFSGGEGFWKPKAEVRKIYDADKFAGTYAFLGAFWNKEPYSFLYDGFYTMKTIYPTMNEISVESKNFREHITATGAQSLSPDFLKENVRNPNYVAFLVKAEEDTTNSQLKVDLTNEAGSRRYTSFRGYSRSKQFYSPDYSRVRPDGKDYRRTLLWNPHVKSSGGKLQLELYNSSECGAIAIDVLGVDGGVFYSNDEYIATRVDESLRNSANREAIEESSPQQIVADTVPVLSAADSLILQRLFEKAEAYFNKKIYGKSINIYAELIQYGYVPAIYRVGYSYRYGLGIMESAPHALEFLKQAADSCYAPAQYEYAMMLLGGEGTEASPREAVHWLEKAAEQEHVDAQTELAKCHLYGNGAPFDLAVADSLLRKASIAGHPEALYLYALRMQRKEIRNDNILGSVIDCVSRSADKGHAEALDYMIQYCRSIGDGENMYKNALRLHQQGDKRGTKALADCYNNGIGVKRDKSLAKDLYREAGE